MPEAWWLIAVFAVVATVLTVFLVWERIERRWSARRFSGLPDRKPRSDGSLVGKESLFLLRDAMTRPRSVAYRLDPGWTISRFAGFLGIRPDSAFVLAVAGGFLGRTASQPESCSTVVDHVGRDPTSEAFIADCVENG